jgi:hypothetical protein
MLAVIAYKYDNLTGDLHWGAAFCHTKVDKFNFSEGRKIAEQRLNTDPKYKKLIVNLSSKAIRTHIKRQLKNYKTHISLHEF